MEYVIPTEHQVRELDRLFLPFDQTVVSIEFCLERIRLGINEYLLPDDVIKILHDIMLGVCSDVQYLNRLMLTWVAVVMRLYYYIVSADLPIPFTEIKIIFHDIIMVTEG